MFTISCMKYAAQYQLPILTLKTPLYTREVTTFFTLQYDPGEDHTSPWEYTIFHTHMLCTTNRKFGITPIQEKKKKTNTNRLSLSELNQHEILLSFFYSFSFSDNSIAALRATNQAVLIALRAPLKLLIILVKYFTTSAAIWTGHEPGIPTAFANVP